MKLKDLTGQKFGRLTVLKKADNHTTPNGSIVTMWKCKCDCGNIRIVTSRNLRTGHTTSCGCFNNEKRIERKTIHGYRHKRIYYVYCKIKDRCTNPQNKSYPRYGGRGITMCDEWLNNPKAFCDWAYENGYDENAKYGECTVDRIDNSKGYSPENCRFANEKEQANNRRSNHLITHNGITKTLAQWRDYYGMTQSKAYYHLVLKGKTIQELIDNGVV